MAVSSSIHYQTSQCYSAVVEGFKGTLASLTLFAPNLFCHETETNLKCLFYNPKAVRGELSNISSLLSEGCGES